MVNQYVNATKLTDADMIVESNSMKVLTNIAEKVAHGNVPIMITGESGDEDLANVSADERAARFSQKATAIGLTGSNSQDIAYQLERKLFDTGHATTVLEDQNQRTDTDSLIAAIKNAGLICLCVNKSDSTDKTFDCDNQSIDDIYAALKDQQIIY